MPRPAAQGACTRYVRVKWCFALQPRRHQLRIFLTSGLTAHLSGCLPPRPTRAPRRNRFEPALEWLLEHAEEPAAAEPLRSDALPCLLSCQGCGVPGWRARACVGRRSLCKSTHGPVLVVIQVLGHLSLPPPPHHALCPAPYHAPMPCSDAQLARLYGHRRRQEGRAVDPGALAMLQDMGFDGHQVGGLVLLLVGVLCCCLLALALGVSTWPALQASEPGDAAVH